MMWRRKLRLVWVHETAMLVYLRGNTVEQDVVAPLSNRNLHGRNVVGQVRRLHQSLLLSFNVLSLQVLLEPWRKLTLSLL